MPMKDGRYTLEELLQDLDDHLLDLLEEPYATESCERLGLRLKQELDNAKCRWDVEFALLMHIADLRFYGKWPHLVERLEKMMERV